MKQLICIPLFLALSLGAAAQGNQFVYFVPTQTVTGVCHIPSCCLENITVRSVGVVEKGTCQDCAFKLTPEVAWNTLTGDEDGNAEYYNPALGGEIDGLLIKQTPGRVDMRQMFISVKARLGTDVSGPPGLRPGDVGAIRRTAAGGDGQVVHFLKVEQVQAALGIPVPINQIDLDAIAVDGAGNVFLSLDANHAVNLKVGMAVMPFMLQNGGVAVIPAAAITYDANGNVMNVAANSGMILLSEAQVDLLVANSRVSDFGGACVTTIGDNDALEIDPNPNGGTSLSLHWGGVNYTFPHLAFGGTNLTGLAVLTTAFGGSILKLGPTPCCMARSCPGGGTCLPVGPSQGFEMGVWPTAASLNALAIRATPVPYKFIVGTCTPSFNAPGMLTFGIQGIIAPSLLLWMTGPTVASGVATSIATPSTPYVGFPDLYMNGLFLVTLAAPSYTVSVPDVVFNLMLQALNVDLAAGTYELSTPATIRIY